MNVFLTTTRKDTTRNYHRILSVFFVTKMTTRRVYYWHLFEDIFHFHDIVQTKFAQSPQIFPYSIYLSLLIVIHSSYGNEWARCWPTLWTFESTMQKIRSTRNMKLHTWSSSPFIKVYALWRIVSHNLSYLQTGFIGMSRHDLRWENPKARDQQLVKIFQFTYFLK